LLPAVSKMVQRRVARAVYRIRRSHRRRAEPWRRLESRRRKAHPHRVGAPGPVWPRKPPGACIPENGSGLGSLVDVYKWCRPCVHRRVHSPRRARGPGRPLAPAPEGVEGAVPQLVLPG
jgi:hypothetical protein